VVEFQHWVGWEENTGKDGILQSHGSESYLLSTIWVNLKNIFE
jgi:hypothetical protein